MDSKITKIIGEIAEQVAENDLSEITYEQGDVKVRVVGKQTQQAINEVPEVVSDKPMSEITTDKKYITSPMVGVVYLTPEPKEAPYVILGSLVNKDTTVCVIEAMKTFNPIKAGFSGAISSILVQNGDPVEYGQPLFEVI